MSVLNLWLALDHILRAHHYRDLGVSYPPLLRAALAFVWGGAFGAAGIALLRRQRRARRWILLVTSNFGVGSVLWLSVFAESGAARARVPFVAVMAVICTALLAWVLSWQRVRARF